jgi:hypothetical protein
MDENEKLFPYEIDDEGFDIGETCRDCIENYGVPCCDDSDEEGGSECCMLDDFRYKYKKWQEQQPDNK